MYVEPRLRAMDNKGVEVQGAGEFSQQAPCCLEKPSKGTELCVRQADREGRPVTDKLRSGQRQHVEAYRSLTSDPSLVILLSKAVSIAVVLDAASSSPRSSAMTPALTNPDVMSVRACLPYKIDQIEHEMCSRLRWRLSRALKTEYKRDLNGNPIIQSWCVPLSPPLTPSLMPDKPQRTSVDSRPTRTSPAPHSSCDTLEHSISCQLGVPSHSPQL